MSVFDHPAFDRHQHVSFFHDPQSGLRAIVAIHNTHRGPALGGCRMWPYASDEEALRDVLRLSRGMTYKSALANLDLGGGKSVIIGDPSPSTAYGTFVGLREAVRHQTGRSDLEGLRVAVQGMGHVGYRLARHLHEAGAKLWVTDIHAEAVARAVDELGAIAVPAEEVMDLEVDVFAPCALGAVIDDTSIPRLRAGIVAGAANNQLAEERHGAILQQRGVLYAPDFVINAGGIIDIGLERQGHDPARLQRHLEGIGETLGEIFQRAAREQVPTSLIANRLAEERFMAP